MNYQRAIELLDRIIEAEIKISDIANKFIPTKRLSAQRLVRGRASDEDLDNVEEALEKYLAFGSIHLKSDDKVEMRVNRVVFTRMMNRIHDKGKGFKKL